MLNKTEIRSTALVISKFCYYFFYSFLLPLTTRIFPKEQSAPGHHPTRKYQKPPFAKIGIKTGFVTRTENIKYQLPAH